MLSHHLGGAERGAGGRGGSSGLFDLLCVVVMRIIACDVKESVIIRHTCDSEPNY